MTVTTVEQRQADVILDAARKLWPRSRHLKVFRHEEDGRWLLRDEESKLWWEVHLDVRPGTVGFLRAKWGTTAKTTGDLIDEEMQGGLPAQEVAGDWLL